MNSEDVHAAIEESTNKYWKRSQDGRSEEKEKQKISHLTSGMGKIRILRWRWKTHVNTAI